MNLELTRVRWGLVLVAGVLPHIIMQLALVELVILGYDPGWGGAWVIHALTFLWTGVAAAVVARMVGPQAAPLHGVLIGLLVALIGLAFAAPGVVAAIVFCLIVMVGWVGGRWSHAL